MFVFIYPYNIRNMKTKKVGTQTRMQMSWWGWGKDDNNDDNKKDDSDGGAHIDWDTYDNINSNNNTPEDRGVIEVPAGSESVIYQDEDGNYYEIDIGELEDYDDEGEIEHSKSSAATRRISTKSKKSAVAQKTTMQRYNNQMRYNAFSSRVR